MMFKSGNFLTAFAISVVPALICIALIVAGQHTCENIPWKLENFHNPLNLGIALIWSGNVARNLLDCIYTRQLNDVQRKLLLASAFSAAAAAAAF